ncbi:hypothetical protein PFISCL1PPCAC_12320, partial [Pristionchus fissidentatus]
INPSFADLTLLGMAFMEMPQQKHVCGQPGVLCGIAEVEERRSFGRTSWEQHMVVLQPSGCLLIYKYYLLGVGTGSPEVGRIVHLNALYKTCMQMKRRKLEVELIADKKQKVVTRLRFAGELVPIWGAKMFLYKTSLPGLMHAPHDAGAPLAWTTDTKERELEREAKEKGHK